MKNTIDKKQELLNAIKTPTRNVGGVMIHFPRYNGGSGGTTDYEDLSNKPKINGHVLTGDQTSGQLGIEIPNIQGIVEYNGNQLTPDANKIIKLPDFASASDLNTKANLVNGKVPTSELPSYVDDVLEYPNLSSFPATGETGKIYVALDTNKTYRWTGSTYISLNDLDLGSYLKTVEFTNFTDGTTRITFTKQDDSTISKDLSRIVPTILGIVDGEGNQLTPDANKVVTLPSINTKSLYLHSYSILHYNYESFPVPYGSITFFSTSQLPLDFDGLRHWLIVNGYNKMGSLYGLVSGVQNTKSYYVSNTDGGTNNIKIPISNPASGIYVDETVPNTIKLVYNYGSQKSLLPDGSSSDFIIKHTNTVKIDDFTGFGSGNGNNKRIYKVVKSGNYSPINNLCYSNVELSAANGYTYYLPDNSSSTTPAAFISALTNESDFSNVELHIEYQNNQVLIARGEILYNDNNTKLPIFSGIHSAYVTRPSGSEWTYFPYKISYNGTNLVYEPGMDLNNKNVLLENVETLKHFKIRAARSSVVVPTLLQNATVFDFADWVFIAPDGTELTSIPQVLNYFDSYTIDYIFEICDLSGGVVSTQFAFRYNGSNHKEYVGMRRDGSNFYQGYLFFSNGSFQWTGFKSI